MGLLLHLPHQPLISQRHEIPEMGIAPSKSVNSTRQIATDWCQGELEQLVQHGLLRVDTGSCGISSVSGGLGASSIPSGLGPPKINLSSNDYLGLAGDPAIVAALTALDNGVVGSGASRLVTGTKRGHLMLEERLAAYCCRPAALVYGSGYLANLGVISAIVGREDVVLADRLIHASMVDGILLSRARLYRYRHVDLDHLRQLLSRCAAKRLARQKILVATESLFSMDGDLAPLREIVSLAEEFDAMLYVDEAHAFGVYGPGGRGVAAELKLAHRVDFLVATLGKSLGVYGGFVCCEEVVRSYLVNYSRPFIYSTSLPEPLMRCAIEALNIIQTREGLGAALLESAKYFRHLLFEAGITTGESDSQIIPILVGDTNLTVRFSEALRDRGVVAIAIRPPTVPVGTARLRLSVSLGHTKEQLEFAARTIADTARKLGIA